ncbi:MAG: 4Fe-4S dicluster domain-containing protein, partial [Candidatus Binatus sp.]
DLLFDCVHCGLCAEACPTYIVTRCEMDSPRGRIYLMKSLADGQVELDDDAARHLDLCLGCRGCETACPSGVHYGRLIEGARSFVERNRRRSFVDRLRRRAIGAIFPYPNRLRALLLPLKVIDRFGLRPALRAVMPSMSRDWLDLLPPPRLSCCEPCVDRMLRGARPAFRQCGSRPRFCACERARADELRRRRNHFSGVGMLGGHR